jgi:excisionase family DNA binding protein
MSNEPSLLENQLKKARLLSVREVAELLGLGQRTVYRLADAGELPSPIRISRLVRWRLSDIETYVQRRNNS